MAPMLRIPTVTSFGQWAEEECCQQCSLLTLAAAVAADCKLPSYLHSPAWPEPHSSQLKVEFQLACAEALVPDMDAAESEDDARLMDLSWGWPSSPNLKPLSHSGALLSNLSQDSNGAMSRTPSCSSVPSSSELCGSISPRLEPFLGGRDIQDVFQSSEHLILYPPSCACVGATPRPLALAPSGLQGPGTSNAAVEPSVLRMLLTSLWDECAARGLFRYDVTACETRVVPGQWGWLAQLNEGRYSKKRATEVVVDSVLQPFDERKFHFGKALLREALVRFEPLPLGGSGRPPGYPANDSGARVVESAGLSDDATLVMINVSPIDYGHVLLVPRLLALQPQQLDPHGVVAALALAREVGSPEFRLGYNSLGAFATINHLHFQGYFSPHILPCQRAASGPLRALGGSAPSQQLASLLSGRWPALQISQLVDYPVRGWVLQAKTEEGGAHQQLAQAIMHLCGQLQSQDQPFNVLMADAGSRVFVWPQSYAAYQAAGTVPADVLDTGVNPAVFEISGHLLLKRSEDMAAAGDAWAARLLGAVSVSADRFAELTCECLA